MSRAFVKEDDYEPPMRFDLPRRKDPAYDAAAALALLEGANAGDTRAAEEATGYRFGEPRLQNHIQKLLDDEQQKPEHEQNVRLIRLAKRFLDAT